MNVELLERIAEVIQQKPDEFDMTDWHCGSAHCIAGWAQVLSDLPETCEGCSVEARNLLRIDFFQAGRLFHVSGWPTKFQQTGNGSFYDSANAAARIAHFIRTEGRE